jgi:hypothetical protein
MSPAGRARIISSMPGGESDRAAVLEDIRSLSATSAPRLDQVERMLTDGYACVLEIEAERLRFQRRLEQRAVVLSEQFGPPVEEVAGLAQGVARASEELAELRAALKTLSAVAQRLRAA